MKHTTDVTIVIYLKACYKRYIAAADQSTKYKSLMVYKSDTIFQHDQNPNHCNYWACYTVPSL